MGAFALAAGPYGTFDQAGNVFEWTEGLTPPFLRALRGGAFDSDDAGLNCATPNPVLSSISDVPDVGFRVAAAAPGVQAVDRPSLADAPVTTVAGLPRRPWRDPQTGRPFFPLAWFSYAGDEEDLAELAAQVANLVLFVNTPTDVGTEVRNPSLRLQGVGSDYTESGALGVWRNPLYEETRFMACSEDTREWVIDPHAMCFGDVNVWVIPKALPAASTP